MRTKCFLQMQQVAYLQTVRDTLLIKDTSTDVSKIAHMYSTMKGGGLDLSKVFMNGCLTTGTRHIA